MSRRTQKPFCDPENLQGQFLTPTLGRRLIVFNRITSTNGFLKRLARRGAATGTLVLADQQTAGRGRLGRQWQSPPAAGLWFSMLLRPRLATEFTGALSLIISAVIADGLSAICKCSFYVKWPNDVLYRNLKVCGILCEAQFSAGTKLTDAHSKLDYVVAGIGININQRPDDFKPEWRKRATSLSMITGEPMDRQNVLVNLVQRLDAALFGNLAESMPALLSRWRALCPQLGKQVALQQPHATIHGFFEDIGEGGELILRLRDGKRRAFLAGEVSVAK